MRRLPADALSMGEVRFVRQAADGRDLVFAYAPDGRAAWGLDLASGQQWWYADGDTPAMRGAITEHWQELGQLPRVDDAGALGERGGCASGASDLLSQRPGHAVLARIAELHAAALAVPGLPNPVLPDEIITWSVGFVGEEAVAKELQRLASEWTVLHAVPIGVKGSDIDHVVIGPAGVLCLNTKHHRGVTVDVRGEAVFVGGHYQRYTAASRYEEERASEIVRAVQPGTPVYSILVVVGARLRTREQPVRTVVLSHDQLVSRILALPRLLSEEDVALLCDRLRHADTWTSAARVTAAPDWVAEMARSLATERAVVADQRRRVRRVPGSTGSGSQRGVGPAVASGRARSARSSDGRRPRSRAGRLAVVLALAAAGLLAGPAVVSFVLSSVVGSLPTGVKPTTPATKTATAGDPCSPRRAMAKDDRGELLVCARFSAAKPTTLVWKRAG